MTKIILLSCACLIGFSLNALPQNIDELEKRYDNLKSIVEKDNLVLDSLKDILENRAQLIENEKQKQNPDKDKIIKLMSGSVSLSKAIDQRQEELDEETKYLMETGEWLKAIYSTKIDSLELLSKTNKENSDKLNGEILFYTERRFLVSPQIEMLSFNPKKMLEIDLSKTKNDDEKIVLKEYLSSALAEVNSVLDNVIKQSKETEDALRLQKKTSKFLAETEFDRDIKIGKTLSSSKTNTNQSTLGGNDIRTSISEQINSYVLILEQLSLFEKTENIKASRFHYNDGSANINLRDYSKLLKELKQKLSDYKLILVKKIEHSK